jgi:hypothetical protein
MLCLDRNQHRPAVKGVCALGARWLWLTVCACALFVWFCAFFSRSAQAQTLAQADLALPNLAAQRDQDWDGYKLFREVLRAQKSAGLVETQTLRYPDLKPEDAVFIVGPDKSLDVGSLARFMRDGGRVVLLDDFGTGDALLAHFGMARVPLEGPEVTIVNKFPVAEATGSHPTLSDVARITLNHASGIAHRDLSSVLVVPGGFGGGVVAVAGAVKLGRLFVVSDASLFINEMMQLPGNRTFAKNLAEYAVDDDSWGKRHGRIFIVVGGFEQQGEYGAEPNFWLDARATLRSGEDWIKETNRSGIQRESAWLLAALVAIPVLMWLVRRSLSGTAPKPPSYLHAGTGVHQGGRAGHAELLAATDTPASLLVLAWRDALVDALAWSESQLAEAGMPADALRSQRRPLAAYLGASWLTAKQAETLRQLAQVIAGEESRLLVKKPPRFGVQKKLARRELQNFGQQCDALLTELTRT